MNTGWFGVPGKTPPVDTKVHLVHQGRTLCGWKPGSHYQFQWCATGIHLEMVECARCCVAGRKLLTQKYSEKLLFPNSKISLFHAILHPNGRVVKQ